MGKDKLQARAFFFIGLLCSHEIIMVSTKITEAKIEEKIANARAQAMANAAQSQPETKMLDFALTDASHLWTDASHLWNVPAGTSRAAHHRDIDKVVQERGLLSMNEEETHVNTQGELEATATAIDKNQSQPASVTELQRAVQNGTFEEETHVNTQGELEATATVIDKNQSQSASLTELQRAVQNGTLNSHQSTSKEKENHSSTQKMKNSTPGAQNSTNQLGRYLRRPILACGFYVLLSYISFCVHMFCNGNDGYSLLAPREESKFSLNLAVFLYLFVMPLVMLIFGYQSTCERGPPDMSYNVYGGFLAMHALIAVHAIWRMNLKLGSFFNFSGAVMDSVSVLVFLSILEHFDMATDAMFPGTASACSFSITSLWLKSWTQSSVPRFCIPLLEAMGFDGFALTAFVGFAFVPQFLQLGPLGSLLSGSIFFIAVGLCVCTSWTWILGTILMAIPHAVLLLFSFHGDPTGGLLFNLRATQESPELWAFYGSLAFFELREGAKENREFLSGLPKLLLENMLQLWIQSSSFGFAFDSLNEQGRQKALLSLGLGLGVAASKLAPLLVKILQGFLEMACDSDIQCDREYVFSFLFLLTVLVVVLVLGVGTWLWIIAKLYYAYSCESHVWNLSSGCIQM